MVASSASSASTAGPSLDELASRSLSGDERAQAALFADLDVRFRQVAKRRVRDDEIDDVVQDALRVVLTRYGDRPDRTGILGWSFTVLRNVVGNRYQARAREERGMEFREEEHSAAVDPIERIAASEVRERVAAAIAEVARRHERCGAVLVALLESLDEGGTPREISQRARERARKSLGEITSGNFHVMLHRCRGRLREQLGTLAEAGSR